MFVTCVSIPTSVAACSFVQKALKTSLLAALVTSLEVTATGLAGAVAVSVQFAACAAFCNQTDALGVT